jgi:hypothetical protein
MSRSEVFYFSIEPLRRLPAQQAIFAGARPSSWEFPAMRFHQEYWRDANFRVMLVGTRQQTRHSR